MSQISFSPPRYAKRAHDLSWKESHGRGMESSLHAVVFFVPGFAFSKRDFHLSHNSEVIPVKRSFGLKEMNHPVRSGFSGNEGAAGSSSRRDCRSQKMLINIGAALPLFLSPSRPHRPHPIIIEEALQHEQRAPAKAKSDLSSVRSHFQCAREWVHRVVYSQF